MSDMLALYFRCAHAAKSGDFEARCMQSMLAGVIREQIRDPLQALEAAATVH
jgi:hypothetical protein